MHDGRAAWNGTVRVLENRFNEPKAWKRPRRIFVCSMSDLFHPDVPNHVITEVWRTMAACPQHTFQVLTKRPKRLAELVGWEIDRARMYHQSNEFAQLVVDDQGDEHLEPVPNVWIGTSVESTRYAWRARALVEVAAPVRFLSVEPMLGPVDVDLTGIDWVLLGGESGPGARPLDLGWMRDLIARSREAGTAVFVKQLGSRYGKQHHDPSTWPDDLRVQEWPTPRIRTGVQ